MIKNSLTYQLQVHDQMTTSDGSSLTTPCILQYTEEMDKKTKAMFEVVRTELESGMCPDQVASVIAYSSGLSVSADVSDQIDIVYICVTYYCFIRT